MPDGIETIREIHQGRGLTLEPQRSEYDRAWLVKLRSTPGINAIGKSPLQVAADLHLAQLFDRWTSGPYHADGEDEDDTALANRVQVQQEGQNPLLFRVTVHFTTEIGPRREYHLDPLLRPAKVRWGFRNIQRVHEKDAITNDAVTNSAGDPLDPPGELDDAIRTVSCTINEFRYDHELVASRRGCVNSAPFLGYEIQCARLVDIVCEEKLLEAGTIYYPTTYVIEFDRARHTGKYLDQGYQESNWFGVRTVMRDLRTGSPYQSPQLLDGAGARLAVGGTAVFREFNKHPLLDFADLGIENAIAEWGEG